MLSFLGNILKALQWVADNVVGAVWAAIVDAINGFFLAISEFLALLFGLLPHMSDAPLIGGGQWLGWLNWFLPVGGALDIISGLLVMYVSFLAIRYMLNLVRAL